MKLIPESGGEDMGRGSATPPAVPAWSRGPQVEAIPNLTYQRFAQQVRRAPDAPALTQAGVTLSYRQLEERVDGIARVLQGMGVGPDVIVGLCLPRCIELVAGVLGVHKAGGACMLLEPTLPPARLRLMLDLARPALVLTLTSQQDRLAPLGLPLLCLDDPMPAADALPAWDPARAPEVHHLASVIFTSGSTGSPKAVATPYGWIARPESTGGERYLLKTDSATTFTRAEILRPLQSGQHLFIAPARIEIDPPALVRYIGACGITHLMMAPAALSALLEVEDLQPCRCLRLVDCIGEQIPAELKRRFLSRLEAELRLGYGCTEVPLVVARSLRRGDDPEGPAVGRPLPLKEVHVLDERMQPLPPGQVGELYLGGEMARGYLHDPVQTAARFVDHPFSDVAGARLFRSGDRGRWLASGELEVLGRLDDQVKLRGFRIELGEVEAALSRQPGLRQAVVLLREDRPGDKRLAAYVVGDQTLEAARLRSALKENLPEYMVPAAIEVLAELPLMANGKVDRKALPAPSEVSHPQRHRDGPRDHIERHLVAIWEQVLGQASIGIRDNFFDLGGHSLLAVQLMARVEAMFKRRLPLDTLWFNGGTVEAMASVLREEYRFGENPELVPIKSGSRTPLFVPHIIGGNLFFYYELANSLDPEQPVYGLQARGVFGAGQPDRSVEAIAAHCIEAMRVAQPSGPYLIAGYSSGGVIAYEMARQLRHGGERVELLALLDTYSPQLFAHGSWRGALRRLLRDRNRHPLQELLYFSLLRPLRLDHLRELRHTAEAHRWAHWSYRPGPLGQMVDFFIAGESAERAQRDLLGWSHRIAGQVRLHHFPGSHGDMVQRPLVREVAARLQSCIDAALSLNEKSHAPATFRA